MARFSGFEELADELEALADQFDRMGERHGRDNAQSAIETGFNRAMEQTIVPEAKENVPVETGELAASIDHESRGWRGNRYRHVFGSTLDDEYARVQEFGTRKKNYVIEPNGDYPLSFFWEERGMHVAFEFVVHPGVDVDQPGPMQSALRDNVNVIQGHVGQAMRELIEDTL